jgi:DNA-binding CsgD family transcriptional regulator
MISAPLFCRRFVGRHAELDFIAERFRESTVGRGAIVFVGGDAGVGKSRLVAEARSRLATGNVRSLTGQCLEHAQAPLAPFVEFLREADVAGSELLRASPNLRAGLSRLLPHAAGSQADPNPLAMSDARGQFAAIREALCGIAAAAPVIATIEDAHWADLATLDCLQFLSERIAAAPVLLLVTYRADELHRRHPLALTLGRIRPAPSIWRLGLAPLSDTEMQALQQDALAGHSLLAAETLREIRSLAEGNPLFAEELLRHAAESGGSAPELPLTLRATVFERLAAIADDERDVLVHAAVFGRRFEAEILAAVMDRPLDAVGTALRRARDLQLIVEVRDGSGGYAFRHALMREALYSELLDHEREPLHRRFAQRLEADGDPQRRLAGLAYHWWAARDPQKALEYSERAGDAATGVLAFKDAALHFERAVEYTQAGRRRAELQAKLGTTLGLAGNARRGRAAIEKAAAYFERADEPVRTSGLCRQIGWLSWVVGDTQESLAWFERSRDFARATPDDPASYAALVNLAMFHASAGDAATAAAYLDEAETFTGTPPLADVSVFYDARAHVHSLRGEIARMIADSASGIDAAQQAGDVRRTINGHINLARAATCGGELDVARKACDEALRFAREGFVTQREFFALVNRAALETLAGEYTAARSTTAEAMSVCGDLDPALVLPRLGDFAIALGLRLQDDELVRHLAQPKTLEMAFRSRETTRIAALSAAFVELAATNGDVAGARTLLHRALGAISSIEPAPALAVLAAAHAEPADVATARALLVRWAEPVENRAGRAYLALFDAYAARSNDDARLLAQSAAHAFATLRIPYYEALALEIACHPERALAIYRQIGNLRDAARVERELTNRRGRTKEQLTGRERDIAQLVAQGKSNAEIAAHFVLSQRTVENHVSSILHKLGLRSRTELALHVQEKLTPSKPGATSARR